MLFKNWLTDWQRRRRKRPRSAGRLRSLGLFKPQDRVLVIERLEDRALLTDLTWVGDVDANWNTNSGGNTNWSGDALPADGDKLIFAGAAIGALNNNTTAGNSYTLQFTSSGYTITGNSITLDNAGDDVTTGNATTNTISAPFVVDANSTFNVGAGSLTASGAISGTGGGVIKSGSGTLTLSNATSSYTGNTTLNDGTLATSSSTNNLGGASNSLIINGGTLSLGGISSPSTRSIVFNVDATITDGGNGNTLAGVISGPGGLIKSGGGILTLSGTTNTFGGSGKSISLTGGAVNVSSDANLGNSSNKIVFTSGSPTFRVTSSVATSRTVDFAAGGSLDAFGSSVMTLNGQVTGTGPISVANNASTGVVVFANGSNSYTGVTTVATGTLRVTADGALGTTAAGTTISNGATLDFQNVTYATTEAITMNGGTLSTSSGTSSFAGTIALNTNTPAINVAGTQLTLAGVISGSQNITKSGSGIAVLSGTNTYTGTTTVSAGTLLVNGSLANGTAGTDVTVSSGATLGGTGTINGTISSSGTIAPGTSPGILNATNSVTLANSSTFAVEIGGASPGNTSGSHDQLNVTGSVTIGTGVSLTTAAFNGYVPQAGDSYIIIANDGADAVSGTFNGLAEGATVASNFLGSGLAATITYVGGTGNDVAIVMPTSSSSFAGGVLTITGTSSADTIFLRVDAGGLLEYSDDGTNFTTDLDFTTAGTQTLALTSTTAINVSLLGGNDTLTLIGNGAGGLIAKGGGLTVTYDGGTETSSPGDSLVLSGGDADSLTHQFTATDAGSVTLVGATGSATYSYSELEPITDTLTVLNRVFSFQGGAETITLDDATGSNMTIDSTLGESVTFANPTGSLTINAGSGDDTVTVSSFDAAFTGSVALNGDVGTDTVNVSTALTLANNKNFAVDADVINLPSSSSDIATSGTGTISLTATRQIALSSGASLATVNGGITLNANSSGTATGNFIGTSLDGASLSSTGSGAISVTGFGGDDAASGSHYGVLIHNGSTVSSTGTGTITVSGTGGDGTSSNHGVYLTGSSTNVSSASGEIQITGASAGTTSFNVGIWVNEARVESTGTGAGGANITLNGTATASGTNTNYGTLVSGTNAIITTVDGDLSITGNGGGTSFSGRGLVISQADVTSTGTGSSAGNISLTGTASANGTTDSFGIEITAAGSLISTVDGDISITGTGKGSTTNNIGVVVSSSSLVSSTGTGASAGTITVNATGGAGTSAGHGIYLDSSVTAVDGAVLISGTGGAGTGDFNVGIFGANGASVTSTGAGTLSLSGTGGGSGSSASNPGLLLGDSSSVTASGSGGVTLTGVRGANSGDAFFFANHAATSINTSGGSATLTVIADSMNIGAAGTINAGSNSVTLRQSTAGTAINLGAADATGTLGLTDAELDRITASGLLTIGHSASGTITVSDAISRSTSAMQLTTGGNNGLTFSGASASLNLGSKSLTIALNGSGSGSVTSGTATTDITAGDLVITAGSGGIGASGNPLTTSVNTLSTDSDDTSDGSQYLSEADSVTTTGLFTGTASLQLDAGTFSPAVGASDIISNTADLTVSAAAIYDLTGTDETIDGLSGSGTVRGAATLTVGANNATSTFDGVLDDHGGVFNLTKTGTGSLTLTAAQTYTGETTINNGTLQLNGSLLNGAVSPDVIVNSGATLSGTGTIAGTVQVNAGGTVAPGNSPGILNTGDITFTATSVFAVEVNGSSTAGTDYDQLNVTGSVTLGSATLTTSGTITSLGNDIVLINNDGSDAISGTFNGLAEGNIVTINGVTMRITYVGGTGNDVVLLGAATTVSLDGSFNLLVTDTNTTTDDTLTIQSDTTNSRYIVSDPGRTLTTNIATATGNGTDTIIVPFSAVTGTQIIVNTLAGNDTLTIDFSLGDFSLPLTFNGGDQTTSDSLTLTGGATFTTVAHTLTSASAGTVDITGNGQIAYSGLEPVTDNLSATDRVFTFNGGAETISVTDATGAKMTIDSDLSESITFANPTGSLTINAGTGDDTVTITSVDAAYNVDLTINGDAGTDTINLNADITFASGENLIVNADSLSIGAGADLTTSGSGVITVTADDVAINATSTLASASTVTFKTQTAARGIDLGTNTAGQLSLTETELDQVTAATLSIGDTNSGAISFSADITRSTNTNINLKTGSGNNIAFGTFSLHAGSGGDVTLTTSGTGAITTGDNTGTDLTADDVTLNAGSSGIGSTTNFLRLAAATVTATTSDNGSINLVEADSITIASGGLNAGTGTITLGSGTFSLGGSDRINNSSLLNVSGATFALSTFNETVDTLTLTSGSITGSSGVLTSTNTIQTQSGSAGAILAGTNGLTQSTSGTTTLSAANTFTGTATISAGTLSVTGSLADTVDVSVSSGATYDVGASDTIDGLSGAGTVTTSSAGSVVLTVGANNQSTATFSGVIQNGSGTVGFTKSGTGTQVLSGANTFSGATTINDGVLTLAHNNALGSTSGVTANANSGGAGITGSRLELQNVTITGIPLDLHSNGASNFRSGLITTTSGTNTWTGSVTLHGDGTINFAAGDSAGENLVVSGNVTSNAFTGTFKVRAMIGAGAGSGTLSGTINLGTGTFFKDDNNNWTISSTGNSWSKTQLGLGSITLGASNALSTTSRLQMGQSGSGNSKLILNGFDQTVGFLEQVAANTGAANIVGGSATTSTFTVSSSTNADFKGTLGGTGSNENNLNFIKSGSSTQTLSGNNTYTGTTTISGGTLALSSTTTNNNLSGSTSIDVQSGTTLNVTALDTGTATDTLILASGQTLKGSGTVTGHLQAASGSTISPGASPGIMNVTGNVAFAAGSTFIVEINGTTVGTQYDQLNVTGNVDLSNATISLSGTHTPTSGDSFTIVSATGTVTNTFNGQPQDSTITLNGQPLVFTYNATAPGSVVLTFEEAPTLTGTAAADVFDIYEDGAGNLIVERNNVIVLSTPLASVSELTLDGGDQNDVFNIDFTQPGGLFSLPIFVNGEGQAGIPGDTLTITANAGAFETVTFNYTNANDGSIELDVDGPGGTAAIVVNYTGLEPIANSGSATDLIFNLPVAASDAVLEDDGVGGNTISQLRSNNGTFETTTFVNPTGSITLVRGNAADTITVTTLPDFDASVTIGSIASPFATGTVSGPLTLAVNKNFSLSASSISFNSATADLTTSGTGTVTLNGDNIDLSTAGVSITSASTVTLSPITAGQLINLGGADAAGTLGLTNAELNTITASTLVIGSSTAGTITVGAAINPTSVSDVTLITGNSAIDFNGGSLTASGTATLTTGSTGSITADAAGTDVTATTLAITSGTGIGTSANPLRTSITNLSTDTSVGNGNQFFVEADSATINASGITAGTGSFNVLGGTMSLGGSNRIADTTSVSVNGGTFDVATFTETVSGAALVSGSITGSSGTLTSTSTYDLQSGSISANLAGTVGATKTTAGTVTLSGTNTYTGTTNINAGNLTLSGGAAIADTGAVVLANVAGAVLTLNSSETIGSLAGGGNVGGNLALNANTLTTGGDGTSTTYAGQITGTGGITKNGAGTFTLSHTASTYSGATTLNAGTLATAASSNSIGNGSATNSVVFNGGTLNMGGFTSPATRPFIFNAVASIRDSGANNTILGVASGNFGLIKLDNGTLNLSGVNTFGDGDDTVLINGGGTISVAADSGLGAASNTITTAGTAPKLLATGTFSTSRQFNIGAPSTIRVSAGQTLTYDGQITGTSSLDKELTGTLVLTNGTNNYTGLTSVRDGILQVTANGALGTTAFGTDVSNNAVLDLANVAYSNAEAVSLSGIGGSLRTSTGTSSLAGSVSFAAGTDVIDVAAGASLTLSGQLTGNAGIGFTKTSTGSLILTNNTNSYPGTTTLSAGTIEITVADGLGASGAGNTTSVAVGTTLILNPSAGITVPETLTLNGTLQNAAQSNTWSGGITTNGTYQVDAGTSLNVTGIVSGTNVTKTGTGTLTLSATNTYTGTTSVNAGTLLVNGSIVDGGAATDVTVAAGATLGGSGTIGGAVSVATTATLAPGSTTVTGQLTTGNMTLVAGTTFDEQINGTTVGTLYDQLSSTGNVDLGGATLNLSGTHTPVAGNSFTFVTAAGTVSNTFNGLANGDTLLFNLVPLDITYNANSVVLAFDATPVINGTGGADDYRVYESPSGTINLELNNVVILTALRSDLTSLTINALAGNDSLTVDYAQSGGFFDLPIFWNGGNDTDSILLVDPTGTANSVTHSITNATDGTIGVDNTSNTGETDLITYTGSESLTDNVTAVARSFTFNGGSDTLEVTDAGGSLLLIDSSLSPSITFANPTASLLIDSGSNNDEIALTSFNAAFIAALTVTGGAGDDLIGLDAALTLGGGGSTGAVSFTAEMIDINASINTTAGATTGSITMSGDEITLGADLSTDGAAVTLSASTALEADASFTIDTESGNNGNAGAINLGGTSVVRPDGIKGRDVTLNTATTGGIGGAISLPQFGTNVTEINDLNVDSRGTTDGVITLGGIIDVDDDGVGNAGTVTLAGDVRLTASRTIDTSDAETNGGQITLTNAVVSATGAGFDLTLTAGRTAAGMTGGNVSLGTLSNAGGSYVDDLSINTDGSATTRGDVTFAAAAQLTGSLSVIANTIALNATLTAGSSSTNTLDAEASITDGNGATVNLVATSGSLTATAATGIDLDTTIATLTSASTTGAGHITLDETDAIVLTSVTTADGLITITAGGQITATSLTSTTDADANHITLTTTTGDILIASISAGTLGDVTLTTASGAILETSSDAGIDITGGDLRLSATTGLGTDADAIESSVSVIAAVTDSGDIHFINTGGLTVGTINALSGVTITDSADTNNGVDNITLVAQSPLTVNAAVVDNAGGNIVLTATNDGGNDDDLTISANVTATGGNGLIDLNAGHDLIVNTAATISTVGTGAITGDAERAIAISGNSKFQSVNGDITLQANQVPVTGNFTGMLVTSSSITSSGSGNVTLNGFSGDTTGEVANNDGIRIISSSTVSTNTGAIQITGKTFSSTAGDDGIDIRDTSVTSSGSGNITLNGTGANNSTSEGVFFTGLATATMSTGGTIAITGTTSGDDGVELSAKSITATGTGTITINGTGGTVSATGDGVVLDGGGTQTISVVNGALQITGTGGTDDGIDMNGTVVATSGSGNITLDGTGGSSATANGIEVTGNTNVVRTSSTGNISITGKGSATGNAGISMTRAVAGTAFVESTSGAVGAGTISLIGTALNTNAPGISLSGAGARINSKVGDISLDGTATDGDGINIAAGITLAISATSTAKITLTGDSGGAGNDGVQLDSPITSSSGAISILSQDSISFGAGGDVTSTSGNVTVTADVAAGNNGGTITMADGALINAGSGLIDVDADGNVTLGGLLTTSNSATAITVDATNGEIIDGGDSHVEVAAASGTAVLVAKNGIGVSAGSGADAAIETTVAQLVASTTNSNILIDETDALSAVDITAGTANITLTAGGAITDTDASTDIAAANATMQAGGAITLDTAVDQLTVTTTATGDITLDELDAVTLTNITSNNGLITITSGGTMTVMSVVSSTDADANDINLSTSAGNIDLQGPINAGTLGDVTLTSAAAIVDNNAGLDLTADDLTLFGTAIGAVANPIESHVSNLEASASAGGVFVANDTALTIGGIGATVGVSATGDINLSAAGTLTVSEDVASSAGTVDLSSTTDVILNAAVSASGAITIAADNDITGNASGTLTSSSGGITLTVDSDASGAGTIQLAGTINSGTGLITVSLPDTDGLLSGVISGSGGFVKNGSGAIDLTAANTFTGATSVNAGTLLINGSTAAGSPITVANGATLSGAGSANGSVTVNAGGTLSPGATTSAAGTINTGSLTLPTGAIFTAHFVTDVIYDSINVTGTSDVTDATFNPQASVGFGATVADFDIFGLVLNDGVDPTVGNFLGQPHNSDIVIDGITLRFFYNPAGTNDVYLAKLPVGGLGDVYVDDDWAGLPFGADPDGAGPAHAFGIDAFAVIQDGVDAVNVGGTVHVYAGPYPENVSIAKNVTIDGISGTATLPEADTVFVSPAAGNAFTISAPATTVTLSDMTADSTTNGVVASGSVNLTLTNFNATNMTGTGLISTSTGDLVISGGTYDGISISGADDVTLGTTTVSATGNVSISAQNAVSLTGSLNAGSSTVSIAANADGLNAESFTMASGTSITTTNNTDTAVMIQVNLLGTGTGNAELGSIVTGTTPGMAGGRVTVATEGGAIVDNNAGSANITSGNAVLMGTAIGTVGNAIETVLGQLEAVATDNDIVITNTGDLSIGGLGVVNGLLASKGLISVQSAGSLTATDDVVADGNVLLQTIDLAGLGQTLTVNSGVTVTSSTGNLQLVSGDNVTLQAGSTLNALNGLITISGDVANADANAGATIVVQSQLNSGAGILVTGGPDNDDISVAYLSTAHQGTITVAGGAGTDDVTVSGTAADEDFYFTPDAPTDATYDMVTRGNATDEPIHLLDSIENLRLAGGSGDDDFYVKPSQLFPITIDGNAPVFGDPGVPVIHGDRFFLDSFGNSFTFDCSVVQVAGGAPQPYQPITLVSIETFKLDPLSAGPDEFYDFNTPDPLSPTKMSPTQVGFTGVLPTTLYSAGLGYGWNRAVDSYRLSSVTGITPNTGVDGDLINDVHYWLGQTRERRVFTTDVGNGWVMATISFGHPTLDVDDLRIINQDTRQIIASGLTAARGTVDHITLQVLVTDGSLSLGFEDGTPGVNSRYLVALSGISVRPSNLFSMGFTNPPAGPLDADGVTIDSYTLASAPANSLVTVDVSLGTLIGTDADPDLEGFQVLTDGTGQATVQIRRPSSEGDSHIEFTMATGEQMGCVTIEYDRINSKKFDFNNSSTSPTFDAATPANTDGYLGVLTSDTYTAARGYGWLSSPNTLKFSAGETGALGDLLNDGHVGSNPGTFRVDLDNGTYEVHVMMGDGVHHQSVSVSANGTQVISGQALTGSSVFEESFQVTVTNGQLDLTFAQQAGTFSNPFWVLNALQIWPLASVASFTPINVGNVPADGTTVTPVTATTTLPVGTLVTVSTTIGSITTVDLDPHIDGVQVAVGAGGTVSFSVQSSYQAGTPELEWRAIDGSGHSTLQNAALLNFVLPSIRRFDFNQGSTAANMTATAAGFIGVRTNHSPAVDGFGWVGTKPNSFKAPLASGIATPDLYRDGHRAAFGTIGQFDVQADPATDYDLRFYLGSLCTLIDNVVISVEGAAPVTVGNSTGSPTTLVEVLGASDLNGDGFISIFIQDTGGRRTGWELLGFDIAEALPTGPGLPAAALLQAAQVRSSVSDKLRAEQLAPIVALAKATLSAEPLTAVQAQRLAEATVRIVDLGPTGVLGIVGTGAILIDDDAAGLGWSTDPATVTPNRYDLLTAVAHELSHLIGHDHTDAGLMAPTLNPGVRLIDAAFSDLTLLP